MHQYIDYLCKNNQLLTYTSVAIISLTGEFCTPLLGKITDKSSFALNVA